ncbi:TOXD [Microsporum canis CBS 113480]|uniref:TOXD n=1 Tax=Arthroderma otae (strain ATCC MYA-4605 / CBS 113480) TaxID=554155 RepID=C5FQ97_ARTOC|nr:TOXD [Microsporum canis CBS 113480]EEQ32050.1 TOXD [Microsporum canis CBS 113480]
MGTSRKVIAVLGPGRAELVDRPLPMVRDRFMLVKPVAIALNPTDWKHVDAGMVGAVVGCDYAGTVEAIGKGVRKKFRKGDRVYGVVHGCNRQEPDDGAFGNYILVKADVQSHIPDNISFEEAATLGVGIITVCQGLYLGLGLDLPTSPSFRRTPVLVYGGSTATGSLGIQFAKLLGAVAAFDYHDLDCGLKIREFTGNKLKLAWDTISLPVSARICAHALSTSPGGRYFALLPEPCPRDDVESSYTMAYYMFGEKVQMSENGPVIPPDHSGFRYAKEFVSMANQLLADGKIKVHPQQVCSRGLAGALDGLQMMRDGKVTRCKLVYRVAETPGLEHAETT